jgi:hypothetical protein
MRGFDRWSNIRGPSSSNYFPRKDWYDGGRLGRSDLDCDITPRPGCRFGDDWLVGIQVSCTTRKDESTLGLRDGRDAHGISSGLDPPSLWFSVSRILHARHSPKHGRSVQCYFGGFDSGLLPDLGRISRGSTHNPQRTRRHIQRRVTSFFEFRLPFPPWMA